jgi:hypothetical protein
MDAVRALLESSCHRPNRSRDDKSQNVTKEGGTRILSSLISDSKRWTETMGWQGNDDS